MLALRHGVDEIVAEVLGVGGHEADALHAQRVQPAKQAGEGIARARAVAVDILPKQHDFLHAALQKALGLAQDVVRAAGALAPAHIGHDAVGAEVVAAVHDGDIGMPGVEPLNRQILGDEVFLVCHADHAGLLRKQRKEQRGQAVQVVRAEGQINEAVLAQDALGHAGLLHHASANADDQAGLVLFELLEPGHVAQGAALGIVAHAAGVEDDQVRLAPVRRFGHAHPGQDAGQFFRIMRVHLAAIGDDVIGTGPLGQVADLPGCAFLLEALGLGDVNGGVLHGHSVPFVSSGVRGRCRGRRRRAGSSCRRACRGCACASFPEDPGS